MERVKKSTSKNNYSQLKTIMHFQDNNSSKENTHDRCFKIRYLTDMVTVAFKQFGIFEEFLSVDEISAKHHGHNSLRNFISGYQSGLFVDYVLCVVQVGTASTPVCIVVRTKLTVKEMTCRQVRKLLSIYLNVLMIQIDTVPYFGNFFTKRDILVY